MSRQGWHRGYSAGPWPKAPASWVGAVLFGALVTVLFGVGFSIGSMKSLGSRP